MNEDIRRVLADASCRYRVHRHETLVSTEDFLGRSRFDPDSVVKTLVFRMPDGGYALAVLRALDKLDYKSLADALGVRRKDLRAADAGAVAGDLGFEVGGVSPITGHEAAIVLVDLRVSELDTVYCGAGNSRSTLEIAADDLIRITQGALAKIAR